MESNILIYGANGYTGQLIVEEAHRRNLKFDIAGRNESALKSLADKFGTRYKVFDLSNEDMVAEQIKGYDIVIHSAGPFIHTAKTMMNACLKSEAHYLDITGEIPVFELGAKNGNKAKEAGIVIIPGCGFDVVPTDCMAAQLHSELPTATHLQLAFATYGGRVSHGTALTMVENLGRTGAVRKEGKITPVPSAYKGMNIPFKAEKSRFAMMIPWGDVSTAYYSTGIPNIETYMGTAPKTFSQLNFAGKYLNWLMKRDFVKNYLRKQIKKRPAGPDEQERNEAYTMVWGKVWDNQGNQKEARIKVPEGYLLTAKCTVEICKRVLDNPGMKGFYTPTLAFGKDLITEVTGSRFEMIG
jgi:short subunit dehydrogenase-like uncharacterized protein